MKVRNLWVLCLCNTNKKRLVVLVGWIMSMEVSNLWLWRFVFDYLWLWNLWTYCDYIFKGVSSPLDNKRRQKIIFDNKYDGKRWRQKIHQTRIFDVKRRNPSLDVKRFFSVWRQNPKKTSFDKSKDVFDVFWQTAKDVKKQNKISISLLTTKDTKKGLLMS